MAEQSVEPDHPPWVRRAVVSAVLVAVLLFVGQRVFAMLAAMKVEPKQAESVARPIAVRVTPLVRTDFRETFVAYGRARSMLAANVPAEVPGVVTWVSPRLEAGAAVAQGEELVRLDDRDLKQALVSNRARQRRNAAEARRLLAEIETEKKKLVLARDEVAASRRELERIRGLQGSSAATRSDYDRQAMATAVREAAVLNIEGRITSFGAQLERMKAELEEIDAAVARAETDLGRTVVKAPFAGRIEARRAQRGERVMPGTALFVLVDLSRVEVPVALPGSRHGQVAVGATVTLRPAADRTRSWKATVDRIAPTVSADDRTFFVYLLVANENGQSPVPPGAFVVTEIEGRLFESVFVLPRTALVKDRVFVATDGVARVRRPQFVAELPHVLLATGGLEEGELLVTTNLEEVADGTRVQAIDDPVPTKDS